METNKIKMEIMDEIVKEVRDEVRDEVKEEIKEEVREDIKTKLKSEIKEKIEGVKTDNTKEASKEKTLYDIDDGLYRLIKDNLSKAEASVVEQEIENGAHGKSTAWYRRHDGYMDDNRTKKYSLWQLIKRKYGLTEREIDELKGSVDIIEGCEKMSGKDKETLVEIKKDVCSINERIRDLDISFKTLYVAIGCLYTIIGGLGLKYICHVSNVVMLSYVAGVFIALFMLLWLNCEIRCDC